MGGPKRVVYILRSQTDPDRHYVGLTDDVERRLLWHNAGPSGHTKDHRPWSVVVSMEFADQRVARPGSFPNHDTVAGQAGEHVPRQEAKPGVLLRGAKDLSVNPRIQGGEVDPAAPPHDLASDLRAQA